MRPIRFDLQSHSTVSDGALAPAGVVRAAARAGIELLALTDHDATEGVDEALAAGAREGIRVVPAAELSSLDDAHEDFHVCAYLVDHHSPAWVAALGAFRADRLARGLRMADALEEAGLALDRAPLERRAAAGRPVGRPHLAQAVLDAAGPTRAGSPRRASDRRRRHRGLPDPGHAGLPPADDADRRRGGRGHPRGGRRRGLAHPFWDLAEPAEALATLDRFAALGMDGVEAFLRHAHRRADPAAGRPGAELGLLTTGSADFHGPAHAQFSRFGAFELHGLEPHLGPIAAGR
jgi:predicted metal-dependent phosphoesterase TrpH